MRRKHVPRIQFEVQRLPLVRQCQILDLARSTAYYQPQPLSESDSALTKRIDQLHMDWPYVGARMLSRIFKRDGIIAGRRHVSTNGLAKYFARYNQHRPHSSLDDKTPDEFYFENLPTMPKAA